MNIINEFFVSFILIKLYFKFKVCRKIKFPLLWKFYFSKWKFYFSADRRKKDQRMFINLGNDYKLNDKTRFSFEFEKTFFGDLNVDWSANANLRYSF